MSAVEKVFRFSFSHPTESKIWGFRKFRDGWHRGEGARFQESDLKEAIQLHSEIVANGMLSTNAFPGLSGEIRVTVYHGDNYAEFTLEKGGVWTFTLEDGENEKEYEEFLSTEQIFSKVKQLPTLCGLSGRSPVFTGILNGINLTAWHSSHPHRMQEFRFSRENAPSVILEAFADTQELSTDQLPESLRFFGSSDRNCFLAAPSCFHMTIPMEMNATGTSEGWIKKLQKTFSKQCRLQTFQSARMANQEA